MPGANIANLPLLRTLHLSLDGHKADLESRVVLLGAGQVGKTAIVEQFLYDAFPSLHVATVEQLYKARFELKSVGTLTLNILDTSGSYEFPAMKQLAINSGDAFVLVFALDNAESFEEVRELRESILRMKRPVSNGASGEPNRICPIVVVGNKSDISGEERFARREVLETIICMDWENGYVECSAKDNRDVARVFQELMSQAKLPYEVGSMRMMDQKLPPCRNYSLPDYPASPFRKSLSKTKKMRNSCQIS